MTVVAKGGRNAASEDCNVAMSHFFGQSIDILDNSGNQRLGEDDPFEFQIYVGRRRVND